jgi:hypothetical protein
MSRGDGRVMRLVAERLTEVPTPIIVLARDVYGVEQTTRAQVEAIRRAVKRLAQQERAYAFRASIRTRSTLNVRMPRSQAEVEASQHRSQAMMAARLRRHSPNTSASAWRCGTGG